MDSLPLLCLLAVLTRIAKPQRPILSNLDEINIQLEAWPTADISVDIFCLVSSGHTFCADEIK